MYTAGLTAREIADLCHGNIATVHLHLKKRQQYQEGFESAHQAALAARHPDRPSTRWRQQHRKLLDFLEKNGRLPLSTGDQSEITLHNWRLRQVRSYANGKISPNKLLLLDRIPNWNIDQNRETRNTRWEQRLHDVKNFVHAYGFLPRYRNFESQHERQLGTWLHNQHQRKSQGTLEIDRLNALNKSVPGWTRTQTQKLAHGAVPE